MKCVKLFLFLGRISYYSVHFRTSPLCWLVHVDDLGVRFANVLAHDNHLLSVLSRIET